MYRNSIEIDYDLEFFVKSFYVAKSVQFIYCKRCSVCVNLLRFLVFITRRRCVCQTYLTSYDNVKDLKFSITPRSIS